MSRPSIVEDRKVLHVAPRSIFRSGRDPRALYSSLHSGRVGYVRATGKSGPLMRGRSLRRGVGWHKQIFGARSQDNRALPPICKPRCRTCGEPGVAAEALISQARDLHYPRSRGNQTADQRRTNEVCIFDRGPDECAHHFACFGDHSDCRGCRGTDRRLSPASRCDAAVRRARRHRRTLPFRVHHGARRHTAQSHLRHGASPIGFSRGL